MNYDGNNTITMIARTWHGVVPKDKGDAYYEYLKETGLRDSRATSGNNGIQILRREIDGTVHFIFTTFWDSYESIKKFAGDNPEKARYYPEDKDYLLDLEPLVDHYEVLTHSNQRSIGGIFLRMGKSFVQGMSKLGVSQELVSIK